MSTLLRLRDACKNNRSNFLLVLLKYSYSKFQGKKILQGNRVSIRGIENIKTKDLFRIAMDDVGFAHNRDHTYLNIRGQLIIDRQVSISRGCRIDVGNNGVVKIGNGTYINPFTIIVIMKSLEIGENCAISWNCQFLDTDFHKINYEGKRAGGERSIVIGNNVWIGSNVLVFKGSVIPNGCVLAAGSVVKGVFTEENALIAGNPARVVKRDVSWKAEPEFETTNN